MRFVKAVKEMVIWLAQKYSSRLPTAVDFAMMFDNISISENDEHLLVPRETQSSLNGLVNNDVSITVPVPDGEKNDTKRPEEHSGTKYE